MLAHAANRIRRNYQIFKGGGGVGWGKSKSWFLNAMPKIILPLFCLSIARMISKSLKSEGRMGLDIDVISTPRLFEAALILGSA